MYFFKLNFQFEGHTDANCFFYIFAIKRKSLLFQFLSRGIRPHIAILTGVQNEQICGSGKKNGHILHKITFEA